MTWKYWFFRKLSGMAAEVLFAGGSREVARRLGICEHLARASHGALLNLLKALAPAFFIVQWHSPDMNWRISECKM